MFLEKFREMISHLWLKLAVSIPVGMLMIEERETIMIVTLLIIITIDCFFGAFLAWTCNEFDWSKLGKKFSKKFLLYFFTLTASFVIHNAFRDILEWWFYTIGSIVTLSEFGSLMNKANKLGFPIGGDIFIALSEKIRKSMWKLFGLKEPKTCYNPVLTNKTIITELQDQVAINTGKIAEGKQRRKNISAEQMDMQAHLSDIDKQLKQ